MMSGFNSKTVLVSALLVGLASCAPTARVAKVTAGRPLHPEQARPELSVPPVPHDEGCIAPAEARRFRDDVSRYYAALEAWTAQQNGWRQASPENVKTEAVEAVLVAFGGGVQGTHLNSDLDQIDGSERWTFVGQTPSACGAPAGGWLHVDSNGSYFSFIADRQCGRTERLKVCGSMSAGGCGRKPRHRGHAWFVRLKEGEGVVDGDAVSTKISVPICYGFEPTEGFNRPP